MTPLGAVVSYALPSVRDEPRRLPAAAYWALQATGIVLIVACFAVFGFGLQAVAESVFCLALVVVTATDLEYRLIPNRVVLPAALFVLAAMTAADPSIKWAVAALGAALVLFLLVLAYPAGMGMGDVKLALLMGAALGRSVVLALVVASIASLVPAIAILVRHGRAGRTMGFPFGPLLALGSLVALFSSG